MKYFFHPISQVILVIACLLLVFGLTGCASQPTPAPVVPKEVVVTKVKTVYKFPPDHLLRDCKINPPPKPEQYVKKAYKDKEAMLVNYAAQQTLNLGECNKDKQALRRWKQEQTPKD